MTSVHFRHRQKGRTMIETLAVICLIGILSVGALRLFGSTMAKLYTNTILKEARMRALMSNKGVKATYGIFDSQTRRLGSSNMTAYGYAITGSVQELNDINNGGNGYSIAGLPVVFVEVGKIGNLGKKINKNLCNSLLKNVSDVHNNGSTHGSLLAVCAATGCGNSLQSCDMEYESLFLAIQK